MKRWHVLSSRPVINSPWLHIDAQSVRTDKGHVIPDYYVGKKADFIMVLAITAGSEILLLREYKHGSGDYVWNLPAGCVEADESPEETATRELLEETGYITDALERVGTYAVSSSWLQDKAHLFIGRNAMRVREPRTERGESIEIHMVALDQALAMVTDNRIQDPYSCILILRARDVLK